MPAFRCCSVDQFRRSRAYVFCFARRLFMLHLWNLRSRGVCLWLFRGLAPALARAECPFSCSCLGAKSGLEGFQSASVAQSTCVA